MAEVGKSAVTGGGGHPGFVHVLQVGDTGGPAVGVRVMVNTRRDDKVGGGHPCEVPPSDHGESGEASGIWLMGDTSSGGSTTVWRVHSQRQSI